MKVLIHDVLNVQELRATFLKYTRKAYSLLPRMTPPRILDIGCGSGLATMELAILSGSEVVGIDINETVLVEMRRRIEDAGLGHRVKAVNASLFDTGFADEESFDILWEEGALHLFDPAMSLSACRLLLKSGGFFVIHETAIWFEGIRKQLPAVGFAVVNELLLPRGLWWTAYYAPLEVRIRRFREEHGEDIDLDALAQYEREIAMVKADPDQFDCGFYILKKP